MEYTAAEVAALTHVSVERLGHYDEAGLVHPTGRAGANGPAYRPDELEQLFLVLAYEELGLGEEDIAAQLRERPTTAAHLRAQRRMLAAQRQRIEDLLSTLATALEYEESGPALSAEEKLQLLADWQQDQARTAGEIRLPSQRSPGTLVRDMKN